MALNIKRALAASVPLVVVETSDTRQTTDNILKQLNGLAKTCPVMYHDLAQGLTGLTGEGVNFVAAIGLNQTSSPDEVLFALRGASIEQNETQVFVVMANPQLCWTAPTDKWQYIVQGIANLRDVFKANGSQLYMLIPPGSMLPTEIKNDVITLKDPLPSPKEIAAIVAEIAESAGVTDYDKEKVTKTLLGLSAFAAEQVTAMSITKQKAIDEKALWERKRQTIEQTPGLKVWDGGERFAEVGGYDNVKQFFLKVADGIRKPDAIVFEDEIDKAYAGLGGDNTGVTQDQLGTQLKYMQDHGAHGIILFGVRGSGKTAIGKAIGNEYGVPTIELDRGAMKQGLLGKSEELIRSALDVVTSISGDNALFVATCNKMSAIPSELIRRFDFGVYFFDLPDEEAREQIWKVYIGKYPELASCEIPNSEGWSGSDIRTCSLLAHELKISLSEAAQYVVPIGVSSKTAIETMRVEAHNSYLNASRPGVYKNEPVVTAPKSGAASRRKFTEVE